MTTSPKTEPAPSPQSGRGRKRLGILAGTVVAVAGVVLANAVVVSRQSAGAARNDVVPVDGGKVHVVQDGPRDAPALVLLHGRGGSTRWWDAVVPALAQNHRVVRIDLLGHGLSGKPSGGAYSIPQQGRRVGQVMDRLGVRRAVVVGHSTGGAVATSVAEQRPDLVTALALIDTGPRMSAFASGGFVGHLLFVPGVGQLLWRIRTDRLVRKSLSSAFSRPGFAIPKALMDDVRRTTYHSLTATSRASDDFLKQRPIPDRLKPLGKPLLVIFGADDKRWRVSSANDYRAVPDAKIEVIPGVGHSPMLEDPAKTTALLLAFSPTPHA
ncbi:alpha/beta fold hydrolase [Actinomadura rupiterrae]|uniref:alpha/beta fold hydrolase n=1 Tax=Actinomadura rupiterrae TaxID=559627 RepID=UPI0020A23CF4|nr:alpha/beta fold hydrolase [Actinomadura rupiterrae]MCP2336520.1 pimeloyl-ACP methyl ester carboxylesterase [Actinomadura rupiterrae]